MKKYALIFPGQGAQKSGMGKDYMTVQILQDKFSKQQIKF